jgi:lipopolysaccharide biosynthesis protein
MHKTIRSIAMYLPQFHPIPENDKWWGKGFTEWTNVSKATPLFKNHYQPHMPADLGFYDLRLSEVREQQAKLAFENGINGFCYYHYWFNGKRVLERPFNEVLASGKPYFPFMLCWANENWTRIWDGNEKDILLQQNYSEDDNIAHIKALLPAFKDARYIKVNGKPVFVFYKSALIPNIKDLIKCWRNEASKEGVELYLCRMESFGNYGTKFLNDGFDASINFEPFGEKLDMFSEMQKKEKINNKFTKWYIEYKIGSPKKRIKMLNLLWQQLDYNEYVNFALTQKKPNYKRYPGITPMWDNTARKKENAFLFRNATPKKYKEWLQYEVNNFEPYSKDENFIFINAWNEWAEGNHLEPCIKFGSQYLDATREVLLSNLL